MFRLICVVGQLLDFFNVGTQLGEGFLIQVTLALGDMLDPLAAKKGPLLLRVEPNN